MLIPKIYTENLFDDWFDDFPFRSLDNAERKLYGRRAGREMLTDVKEHEDHYDVEIELPGFKKDEINVELEKGYLTVTASKGLEKNEENEKGKIVRRERYSGTLQRSFYVGEQLSHDSIKAKYEDGVLTLTVPKEEEKKLPEKHTVAIEG